MAQELNRDRTFLKYNPQKTLAGSLNINMALFQCHELETMYSCYFNFLCLKYLIQVVQETNNGNVDVILFCWFKHCFT